MIKREYIIYTGERTSFVRYDTFENIFDKYGLYAIKIEEI